MSAICLTVAIAFILLGSNFVVINAQQQQQQVTSQLGTTNNGAFATATPLPAPTTALTTFQNTNDSFRVQVPQGWQINDVNNTGPAVLEEARLGYGMLAQLCPEEEELQPTLPNVNVSGNTSNCLASQNEVIHVIRYPDLQTRIPPANNATNMNVNNMTIEDVLSYTLQKLQEVGYRNIQIANNTDMRVNITDFQTNQTLATLPAKFVEMTYSTGGLASNELRRSYFILTATAATPPNEGTVKGYSVFYEDNGNTATAATSQTTSTSTAATFNSLVPISLPSSVKQVFDSFELITLKVPAAPSPQRGQTTDEGAGGFGGGGNGAVGGGGGPDCDSSYPDNCMPSPPPNLNCGDAGVPQDFRVLSSDPHGLDGDNDGIGCESSGGDDASDDSAGDADDGSEDSSCHPSYPDTCIAPPPPDLNCDDIEDTNFEVVGSDPHGLDGDNDGIGCESSGGGGDVPDDDDGGDDDGGNTDDCIIVGDGDIGDDCDFVPDEDDDDDDSGDDDGGEEPEPEPEPGDGGEGGGENDSGDDDGA